MTAILGLLTQALRPVLNAVDVNAWALRQRPRRSPRQGRTYHGRRGRQRRGRMEWHLRL